MYYQLRNTVIRNRPVLLWSGFILCLVASGYLLPMLNPAVINYGDSVQYWAAGRLLSSAGNPYSAEQVLRLRHQAGIFVEFPSGAMSMVIYPPWTLPILILFGIPDYVFSRLLWFLFHLTILFSSAILIWRLYHGSKRLWWLAMLIAFSFMPTFYVLLMGHFTTLHLLGIVSFLYFVSKPNQNAWFNLAAGASAALVTFKPQLLYLLMLALFLWVLKKRRWFIYLGGGLFILLLSTIASAFDRAVFLQFWDTITTYPVGAWMSPAIGTVLRNLSRYHQDWLQIIPSLLGSIWFGFYWLRHKQNWDWFAKMPVLILVSFVTSPFMWPYDMVVLLLPVLKVFIDLIEREDMRLLAVMSGLFLGINAATFYHFLFIHNYYYLSWLAPAYLAWYLLGSRLGRPSFVAQSVRH